MKVGARVQARERMLSYRLREDGIVVVSTNKGEYLTKKLCVTAGDSTALSSYYSFPPSHLACLFSPCRLRSWSSQGIKAWTILDDFVTMIEELSTQLSPSCCTDTATRCGEFPYRCVGQQIASGAATSGAA